MHCSRYCLAFILAVLWTPELSAQVLYGSLTGSIFDTTDAPVAGAHIHLTHVGTNQSRAAESSSQGTYRFPTLPSGRYTVRVEHQGFQTVRRDIDISINATLRADFHLQLANVSEAVQVTAEAPALQTDRAETRAHVDTKTLTDAPVPVGRNYQNLLIMVPGFTPPESSNSIPSNPSRALTFTANGTTRGSVNVRIDGATATNIYLHHITAYVPALESIEAVDVVTGSFDAEQGLAGGAAINVQIRSGSNEVHGAAFGYHFNNHLKAKNFFLPQGERNPKMVSNQFGGRLGGPIVRNRLFYFLSYEGTLDRRLAAAFGTVASQRMRGGDLSESLRPVYDPMTGDQQGRNRTPFAGNLIPANRIHPISTRLAGMQPLPNIGGGRLQNNYYAGAPFSFDRHTFDTKVNWNLGSRLSMYTRLSALRFNTYNQPLFGTDIGGPAVNSGNPGTGWGQTWSSTIAATYTVTPNFVVDGHFGLTLMDTSVEQPLLDRDVGRDELGLPGTNGTRRFEGGLPTFAITSLTSFGSTDSVMPYYRHDPAYQYVANGNYIRGRHNIRFGIDIAKLDLNHNQPQFNGANFGAAGGFGFAGGPTLLNASGAASANEYNSFGTFLLGLPTTWGRTLQVPEEYTTRTGMLSTYVRDQFQASRRLTISYGVRYEHFPMPVRADRGMERYDFQQNKMLICGIGNIPKDCGVKQSRLNFAPRLGIAYRPSERWVVRAGYALNWDPLNLVRLIRTNYPVLLAVNGNSPSTYWYAGRTFDQGIPEITAPDLGNGVIDIPRNVAVTTIGDEFRRGYIQSWNFTIQRELAKGFVGQIGYVGTRTIRQAGRLDLNAGQVPGLGAAGQPYNVLFGRTVQTAIATTIGHASYNGMQSTLSRRFANGVQLNAAYTWSKAMGVCCNENSDGNARVQALSYYNLNRALMEFDRTHNLQIAVLAELPFGRGKSLAKEGVASTLLGGWQLNTITSAYSGQPFSVTSDAASLNMPGNTQRADVVGPIRKLGGTGPGQAFYDWRSFAPVREMRFGTAGYSILRGAAAFNSDLGVFRTFSFTERVGLQFRAEVLNWTNTPKFGLPSANISNLRLSNPADASSYTGGVFEITSTAGTGRDGLDERIFRLGLRLSF